MILLQQSMLDGLTGDDIRVEKIREKLQAAIELEHSTVPLYLYALYSLDPAKNGEIVSIIRSVVVEEMLHMTLASNVLNAIGGSPRLDDPKFIPTYPGPLPGGVEKQLTVQLAPFSMAQLETFLTIEEPQDPLNFKLAAAQGDGITIGDFYRHIAKAIAKLGPSIFVPGPHNQVGPDLVEEFVVVTDVASAGQAITTIVEQGEGTSKTPLEIVGKGYAHYYRFMQIKKHYLLEPKGDSFAYDGPPVPFDPAGVLSGANPDRGMELSARVGGGGGKRHVQLHLYQSAESAGCAIQRPEYGRADEPHVWVDDVAEGIGQSDDERYSRQQEVQRPDLPISAGEPPTRLVRQGVCMSARPRLRGGKDELVRAPNFVRRRSDGHRPAPQCRFPWRGG